MQRSQSKEYFERAKVVIPGGVNSPVRAFRSVGMEPAFIARAQGSKLYDVDGNTYIDFIGSWGPMILGHAHPKVVAAVKAVIEDGTSYGAPTLREVELAELIVDCVPSIEMLRLVSSGTEAVMSAVRLARGFTGREKIIKFEGCYHGHSDGLLVKAGSGAMTTGVPDSSGVPESFARHTLCAPYNDLQAVESLFAAHNGEVAAVIVEPVAANMGVVAPKPGYLEGLRKLCDKAGALLIFDEVISGFRMALGGAQSYYGVLPDLTVFGKIIGGGLPIGAYGGKKEIMACISPLGKVYQAGTLSGNPVATMAGIQTLRLLQEHPEIYPALEKKAMQIESAFLKAAENSGMPLQLNRVGSLLCAFFTAQPVIDYATALTADVELFKRFFQKMFYRGFYIAPSQFEAWFFSVAHTDEELESTSKAISEVFEALSREV